MGKKHASQYANFGSLHMEEAEMQIHDLLKALEIEFIQCAQ